MIIGSIVAILVTVWFYNTANGRNPIHWAIAGFLVYSIISLLWTVGINPAIKDAAMHSRNSMLMWAARYAYIVIATIGAIIFNLTVGNKSTQD